MKEGREIPGGELLGLFAGDIPENPKDNVEGGQIYDLPSILEKYIADESVRNIIVSASLESKIWESYFVLQSPCCSENMISLPKREEVLETLGCQIKSPYRVSIPSRLSELYESAKRSTRVLIDRISPEPRNIDDEKNPLADALERLVKFADTGRILRSQTVDVYPLSREDSQASFILDLSRKYGPFSFNAILLAESFYRGGEKDGETELDFKVQVHPYFKEEMLCPVNRLSARILKDPDSDFFTVVLVAETFEANRQYDDVLSVLVGNSETGKAISLTSLFHRGSTFLLSGNEFEAGGALDPFHKVPKNFLIDYRRVVSDLENLLTINVLHEIKLSVLAEKGLSFYLGEVGKLRVILDTIRKKEASSRLQKILMDLKA